MSAQTQGRVKLRENATDEERAAVTDAVATALDRIADEEGIDASGFGFAVEDLAFQFFNITGDAETAAEDAAALFANQLQTLAPEGGASSEEQEGSFPEILFLAATRKKRKSQKKGRKKSEDDTDNETMSEEEKLDRITEIAELLISLIPVVGSTISGVEAIIATKVAIKAFEDGDFEAAEKAVIDVMTSSAGLIPGGKILARGGRSIIRKAAKEVLEKIGQRRPSRIISRNLSKEDVAKRLKINRDSPSLDLLMQHREGTVRDFISKTRAGKINEVFPGEFLDMNLIDAIVKDNKRVRKLLRNRRFEK